VDKIGGSGQNPESIKIGE